MFTNYDHGRFSVIDDGTLVIESVVKEDAGEYVCKGLSIAGSAYAKARLEVRGMTPCHTFSFYHTTHAMHANTNTHKISKAPVYKIGQER